MSRTTKPETERPAATSLATQYRAIGPAALAAALLCTAKKTPAPATSAGRKAA